jgi:hypothetical protein
MKRQLLYGEHFAYMCRINDAAALLNDLAHARKSSESETLPSAGLSGDRVMMWCSSQA